MKKILILSIMVFSSFAFGLNWALVPADLGTGNTQLFPGPVANGSFYIGTYNTSTGGQLFRMSNITVETISSNGFGNTTNEALRPFPAIFDNDLYVFADNSSGLQVWKSPAGSGDAGTWTNVETGGFGAGSSAPSIAGSVVYSNALYVGYSIEGNPQIKKLSAGTTNTNWADISVAPNAPSGALVPEGVYNEYLYVFAQDYPDLWRYNGSKWETITTNGFGDTNGIMSFFPAYEGFKGYLYVGANSTNGAQIWRSATGGTNIANWAEIFDFATNDVNNTKILSFSIPGDGYLYFSTENPNSGTEVWRTAGGSNDFEQVNIDGFVEGQGYNNLGSILARNLFNGLLIAGTKNQMEGGMLYGTSITIPNVSSTNITNGLMELTNVLKEDALQILGSAVPGFEGTFDPADGEALVMKLKGIASGFVGSVHFRIFTLTGETIFDSDVPFKDGQFNLNLPPDIASGVYIIEVHGPNFHFTKKLAVLQ